jgi:hypothetical protein
MPAFIEEALASRPTPTPTARADEAAVLPASSFGVGLKVAVLLVLLLLAGAAGSGAAAAIEARPATWESTAVVQLTPGDAPSKTPDLPAAVARYRGKAAKSSFTELSAFKAGLISAQVRENVLSRAVGSDQIQLVVRAATAPAASELAAAAAQNLLETVTSDQGLEVPAKGDRVRATVTALNGSAVRVKPTDRDAAIAGGLGAAAVLLIGAVVLLLRPGKSSAKEREDPSTHPLDRVR